MSIELKSLDLFYLSYDEPNAEEHWADIRVKAPWAKRVHGVKGFDAAHKECARRSTTDRFIVIDADNYIDPRIFDVRIEADPFVYKRVYSWSSKNIVNNLVYGNGGIKCWSKQAVLEMRTHESARSVREKVEFCWSAEYHSMYGAYSTCHPNGSPEQAFRSGFREGVKMCLSNDGERVGGDEFHLLVPYVNRMRASIWCSIGAEIQNGLWMMYGARLGCTRALLEPTWDHGMIANFDMMKAYWNDIQEPIMIGAKSSYDGTTPAQYDEDRIMEDRLWSAILLAGSTLRKAVRIEVADYDKYGSLFYKNVYVKERDKINERPDEDWESIVSDPHTKPAR